MDNNIKLKRVLHIVSSMDRGGAETLIMNIYRNLDRSNIQFDFITHNGNKGDFDDEITSLGGKIYRISSLGETGPFQYIKDLKNIMSNNKYEAIHSHTDYQSGFPALAAKLCGIKKRVCHSHSTNWPKTNRFKDRLTLRILQTLIKFFATSYCSCSIEAAEFLFGKKMIKQGKVNILRNGINIDEFLDIEDCKGQILKELVLPNNAKIIGHVGRFSESKNQIFILKALKKILEFDTGYVALFVGDGPLKTQVEKEAENLGIVNHVRFLGVRDDIPRLMKIFDVFLFPSLYEGFGIVTLEAQCAGTPCVVSNTIPKSIDMGIDLVSFLSLEKNVDDWSKTIQDAAVKKRPDKQKIKNNFIKNGFSINENVPAWLSLYADHNEGVIRDSTDILIRG